MSKESIGLIYLRSRVQTEQNMLSVPKITLFSMVRQCQVADISHEKFTAFNK